jgi:glucokinase-like ROK family protein
MRDQSQFGELTGTGDSTDATRLVLDAIRLRGCRSRTEIVERTGLSRSTVAQRLGELFSYGLVDEDGHAPSTGGRRPRHLRFRAEAGRILTADLGASSIDVALADLGANILEHRAEPADIATGPEAILGRVEILFDQLTESAGQTDGAVWGMGIGIPGPVEFNTGKPVAPPIMPGWDGYPIRERFETRFNAPVWVDNDVNLMAMGEWRHGLAAGHSNVVFVKIGTGIGAGLISDGVLHRGAQGAAGDIGHVQVSDDRGVICRCGNVGCLEAVAGGAALATAGLLLAKGGESPRLSSMLDRDGSLSAISVAEAAAHGDSASLELITGAGRMVGRTLATVVNFFNPSLVVIGGGVAGAGDSLLAAIREAVYRRSLPLATRQLHIAPSALGGAAGVTGAAAVVADELFGADELPATFARHVSKSKLPILEGTP